MQTFVPGSTTSDVKLLGEGDSFRPRLCQLLEGCKLLEDMNVSEIEYLAHWFKAYAAPAYSCVINEGDKQTGLYLVNEGRLEVLKQGSTQQSQSIAQINAGKCIGEMSLIDGCSMSATVIAKTDTILLVISRMNFETLLERNPKLGVKLLLKIGKMISLRLRQATGKLADFIETETKQSVTR
jgi:CRP/FNR family transcriptional regulator, cyclic AMP receptor protein